MANYFCTDSVEEQVDYLTDKVKDIITNKLDKASIVQETGTGTDVVMSQKAVTDAITGKGLDTLTDVNLTLGDTTVQYDTTEGIQINSTARFTDAAGNHDAMMDLALPILGTDGITIDKAADSENIEVSGKNLIKDPYPGVNNTGASIINCKRFRLADWGSAFLRNTHALVNNANSDSIVGYDNNGIIYAKTTSDDPWSVVNKEYAEDNFRKVVTGSASEIKVYTTKYGDTQSWMFLNTDPDGAPGAEIPQYGTGGTLRANMPATVLDNSVVNKKYADENYVNKITAPDITHRARLYAVGSNGSQEMINVTYSDSAATQTVPFRDVYGSLYIPDNSIGRTDYNFAAGQEAVNKKYVDDLVGSIASTIQSKYQHSLILEGTKDGFTFKAFLSVYRSDDAAFGTFDEIVQAIGSNNIPCTGYVYDGTKFYSIFDLDGSGPVFNYLNPELGEQMLAVTNDDVTISDDVVLEF